MNRHVLFGIFCTFLLCGMLTGCHHVEDIPYISDAQRDSAQQILNNYSSTILPGDNLYIYVESATPESVIPFNQETNAISGVANRRAAEERLLETVSAVDSTNLGGNDSYWSFIHEVHPGDPIAWNGSADSVWANAANWTDGTGVNRTPQVTDCITIPARYNDQTVTNFPILSAGVTDAHTLEIEQGATMTLDGGNLRCDEALAVAGTLTCVGGETLVVSNAMTVTGTLNAGRASITCYGPVEVTGSLATEARALLTFYRNVSLGASTYAAPLATFRLAGAGEQAVALSENAFFAFEVAKTGGGVTFADGFSADALTLGTTGAAAVLTFALAVWREYRKTLRK